MRLHKIFFDYSSSDPFENYHMHRSKSILYNHNQSTASAVVYRGMSP